MDAFVVTKEWIAENATPKGGYTYEQLRIIGCQIPPVSGWAKRAAGRLITIDQKNRFEAIHNPNGAVQQTEEIDSVALDDCQKAFEVWAKRHVFSVTKDKMVISEGAPIYANPMTQGAYMAWCASRDGS